MIDNDHGSERFRVRGRAGSSEERGQGFGNQDGSTWVE